MKCHETKRRLDPWLDGELTVAENLQLLEHLQLCPACQDVFESEKTMRTELRGAQHAVKAPSGLADRALGAAVPPLRRRRLLFVAAAAAMFVVFGSLLTSPAPSFEALAGPLAERHATQRYACGDDGEGGTCCCAGCGPDVDARVSTFFARVGRPDFCAHPDLQSKLGYAFEGVAAWRFRGEQVCWATWKAPSGERVSHALLPSSERSARLGASDGRPILLHPRGDGLACVFVFASEAELRRFAEKSGVRLPSGG